MNRVVVRSTGTRICICSMLAPPTRMLYGNTSGWPIFQSSSSSDAPSTTRRLMMPQSKASKPTLTCLLPNEGGASKPWCLAMNAKNRPCSHSVWCGSTAFSMICTKLQGSSVQPMSRTPSITNTSKRGSSGAGSGPI